MPKFESFSQSFNDKQKLYKIFIMNADKIEEEGQTHEQNTTRPMPIGRDQIEASRKKCANSKLISRQNLTSPLSLYINFLNIA